MSNKDIIMNENTNATKILDLHTDEKLNEANQTIKICDLIDELQVLFEDYFVGDFTNDGEKINAFFKNGQHFAVRIEEMN